MADDPRSAPGADDDLWVIVNSALDVSQLSVGAEARLDPAHGPVLGASLVDFVHPDDMSRGLGAFAAVQAHSGQRPAGTYRIRTGPSIYETFDVTGEQLDSADPEVLLKLIPVDERRRSEILAHGQVEILEMAAAGASLDRCMNELVALCESFIQNTAAVVHILDNGHPRPTAGSVLEPKIAKRLASLRSWREYSPFQKAQDRGHPYFERTISELTHWQPLASELHASPWHSCVTSPIQDSAGRPLGFIEVLRISETRPDNAELTFYDLLGRLAGAVIGRRKSEAELHKASREDRLTGLGDARALMERLRAAAIEGGSFSLLVIDLDRFRWINNNFGHSIGDALLRIVGARFAAVTESVGVTYRHSGNAFIVHVPDNVCIEELVELSTALLRCLDNPIAIKNTSHTVTASVGVARYLEARDKDLEGVLARAEAAMYAAKDSGGDAVRVYSLSSAEQTQRRMSLASVFLRSLDDGQFNLVYQPVYAFETGKVIGAETLARWHHPTLGMVSPDEFVPIAEQSGFFVDLDQWVLAKTYQHHLHLNEHDLCAPVYKSWVNLAPRTLEHPDAMHLFDGAGSDLQQFIGLEITERQGFKNLQRAAGNVSKLREQGFDIALDDYGSGRASLVHLAELDVTELKIDKGFIAQLENTRIRQITEHTVALGHSLGLRVTAEGIETEQQYRDAKGMGFDTAQGYLLSRPVPRDQLTHLLEASPAKATQDCAGAPSDR